MESLIDAALDARTRSPADKPKNFDFLQARYACSPWLACRVLSPMQVKLMEDR